MRILLTISKKIGNQFFSDDYMLVVDRENLIIAETDEPTEELLIEIKELPVTVSFGNFLIKFSMMGEETISSDRNTIECSGEKIGSNVRIRTWKQGDTFYPLGMDGHSQSLKKFFANNKIDRIQKKEIPVICDADDNIIWIAGFRQDARYTADSDNSDRIQISIKRSI